MKKPGKRFPIAVLGMGLAALAWCGAGHAQDPGEVVFVSRDPANSALFASVDAARIETTVRDGVRTAARLARETGGAITVQIDGSTGPYVIDDPIPIPADAAIHILGVTPDDTGRPPQRPWEVVFEGDVTTLGAEPLIHIHTEENSYTGDDESLNYQPGGAANGIRIEGITLRAAQTAVRIGNDVPPSDGAILQPQLSRCIILGDEGGHAAGIDIRTNAAPIVANCVVGAYQDDIGSADQTYASSVGIRVRAGGALDLIFGSILFNSEAGIRVETGATARIRNTLVYSNGTDIDDNTQGGIVFDSNPFMTPSSGPYDATTGVTIYGGNFANPDVTAVYFGPQDRDGTTGQNLAIAGGGLSLTVDAPPSYLGTPGPVNVTLVREDGHDVLVEQAFTYTDTANEPIVTQVVPGEGPIYDASTEAAQWVAVYGARFEKDCQVYFDVDGSGTITAGDLQSARVQWFSSAYLWVRVPPHDTPTNKIDVLVRNPGGGDSPAGAMREYQYVSATGPIPSITQVSPNVVRDLQGTEDASNDSETIEIVGWNFGPGEDSDGNADPVIVKIGGVTTGYDEIDQGADDANGDSFDAILGVIVPTAALGAGGAYDVEVINADGRRAVLPNGLTYFANGAAELDNDGAADGQFPWFPANFVPRTPGPAELLRTLRGSGFDTGLAITLSAGGADVVVDAAGDGIVLPNEPAAPHQSHTQREVIFGMPPLPEALGLSAATETAAVEVANVEDLTGGSSAAASTQKTAATEFHWVSAPALEISDVAAQNGGASGTVSGSGFTASSVVYVAGYTAGNVTLVSSNELTFDLPAGLPEGLYGLLDVTVENPGPPRLYYTVERAFSRPRLDTTDNPLAPEIYAVEPRVWPVTGGIEVRVLGSGFLGPYDGLRMYTDVGVGANAAVAANTGLDMVSDYRVISECEIRFALNDMTALFPPGSLPVLADINVLHYNPGDPASPVQGGEIQDGVYFVDAVLQVADAYCADRTDPAAADFYPERFGSVRGGDVLTVIGSGFTDDTRFLVGNAEAEVLAAGNTFPREDGTTGTAVASATERTVVTPPAAGALPGMAAITALEPVAGNEERAAVGAGLFTYIMDGAPVITSISPNQVSRDESNLAALEDQEGGVYFTIYGTNFDNVAAVLFNVEGTDDAFEAELPVFSTSPFEMVVKAPASDEALGLDDGDYTGGNGRVRVDVTVRNGVEENFGADANVDSNTLPVYYYDDTYAPLETDAPVLAFNDVHLNSQDYVNAQPGTGSISVDPMLDPGPADERRLGPKVVTRDAEDWWLGKLALGDPMNGYYDNPLRDRAGDFSLGLFTFEDLELDGRPNFYEAVSGISGFHGQGPAGAPKSDIGADELSLGGLTQPTWYYAELTPAPIGALAAGELEAEVRIRGLNGPLPDGALFLVPQGGNPGVNLHRIPLDISRSYGRTVFYATNAEAIETDIARNEGGGSWSAPADGQTRQPGDLVADGHGALFVFVPNALSSFLNGNETIAGYGGLGRILGYTASDYADDGLLSLRDAGLISSEAVDGRHVLIDTTPPRIFVEAYPAGLIGPWDLVDVTGTNDTFSINRSDLDLVGPANHAGLNLPAETWPAGNWFNLNAYMGISKPGSLLNVPAEWEGVLQNTFRIGGNLPARATKVQAFFNTGSISNGLALPSQNDADDNLDFTVVVRFVDPVVTVATPQGVPYFDPQNYVVAGGASNFGPHTDRYTGLRNRQVSGFEAGTQTFGDLQDLSDEVLIPAVWRISAGLWGAHKTGASATATFSTDAANEYTAYPEDVTYPLNNASALASNTGFSPTAPGSAAAANNNELQAQWVIQNLDWDAAQQAAFRIAVQFAGRDRAGNETEISSLLDPLYLNWGLGVQTEFIEAPAASNSYLARWRLLRDQGGASGPPTLADPETEEGPAPLFMYRLFINYENPGLMDGRYWHVYTSQWSTRTSLNEDDIRQILSAGGFNPDVNQYYLMLVVLGADEAGNVEPWLRGVPYWTSGGADGAEGDPLFDAPFQPVEFRGTGTPAVRRAWDSPTNDRLPNFVRFSWTGAEVPDTTVSPVFWHGDGATPIGAPDERLGSNLRVVLPEEGSGQRVDAEFILGAEYQDRTNLRVVWELSSTLPDERTTSTPLDIAAGNAEQNPVEVFNLGDPNRREAITYTFRAAAYVDSDANGQHTTGEPIDPTWANVSFVVTPYAVDPGLDPLDQPIKITEEQ